MVGVSRNRGLLEPVLRGSRASGHRVGDVGGVRPPLPGAGPEEVRPVKYGVYECGVDPLTPAAVRVTVKFYLVAILFILFDLETTFLYPWAVLFRSLGLFGFIEMAVFVGILLVGLVYAWKKGALEWQ